ncbi:unnamed protein product [Oncorhynchus mykiss]|uniref:Uncharacterized protein n=1 Tax=Oncorhynchus mykiss TaxID=8022 RepID=A0A060XMM5_ONCMY|nr:unnamed protein product [Oncorhynchus mykiss]
MCILITHLSLSSLSLSLLCRDMQSQTEAGGHGALSTRHVSLQRRPDGLKTTQSGKPGGAGSQSQPSPCDPKTLGPKGPIGSLGLKNGQGLIAGNGAKGKMKRERSTSVESFEQRDTGTSNSEGDQKELGSRAKRLCVAERRQPYSGADWCSGGESDEEDPGFFNCNSIEMKPLDSNNALSSATSTHNAVGGQSMELGGSGPKPGSKVVYVFTTEMANNSGCLFVWLIGHCL